MSYDFDTLYTQWVDDLRSRRPNISERDTSVQMFVDTTILEIEDYINEGEADLIPPSLYFIVENAPT